MSYGTVKANTIENSNGQTGNAIGPGFKNRIINGAMMIDQRNAGAAVTADGAFAVDRFQNFNGVSGATFSAQRSTTVPDGFTNSLYVTCTTAGTLNAGAYGGIRHSIEGLNTADLSWGSSNAVAVTISFWVRSSLTGNFGVVVRNSAGTYGYVAQYTVSSANTWERKTLTIPGPTSGTWLTNNGIGIQVVWDLGAGSTYSQSAGSWVSSGSEILGLTGGNKILTNLNSNIYITGVQLEVGPSATSFDYRPYGTELMLCQRYYEKTVNNTNLIWSGDATTGNNYYMTGLFSVSKRASPTFTATITAGTGFGSGAAADAGADTGGWNIGAACNSTGVRRYYTAGFTASAEL